MPRAGRTPRDGRGSLNLELALMLTFLALVAMLTLAILGSSIAGVFQKGSLGLAGWSSPVAPSSGFAVLTGVNTPAGFSMTFDDPAGVAPFSVYRSESSVVDTAVLKPLAIVDGGSFVDTAVRPNHTYMVYDSTGQGTNKVMAATGFTNPVYLEAGEMDFYVTAGSAPVRRYAGTPGTSVAVLKATLTTVTPDASGAIWTDKAGSIYTLSAAYTPTTAELIAVDARFEGAPFFNQPINPPTPAQGIVNFIGPTQHFYNRYGSTGNLLNKVEQHKGRWGTYVPIINFYPDLFANLATPEARPNSAVGFLGDSLVSTQGWWSVTLKKDGTGDVPRGHGEDTAYRIAQGPRTHTPYGLVAVVGNAPLYSSKSLAAARAGQLSRLTTTTAGDPGGVPTTYGGNINNNFVAADSLQRVYYLGAVPTPTPTHKVFAYEWNGTEYSYVASAAVAPSSGTNRVVEAVSDTDLLYVLDKTTRVVTIYDFGTSGFAPIATISGLPVGVTAVAPLRTTDLRL